jgi:hypothetical protein
LEDTVLSILYKLSPESSHLSSHVYISLRSAETLLDRKARVVALWELTRCIPPDLEKETKHLKIGQLAFQRKSDVIVQVWTLKKDLCK